MTDERKLEIRDFRVTEVSVEGFKACWKSNLPVRCRVLVSTSPSTVGSLEVPAGTGTEFSYDSRGTGYSPLPPMGQFFLRVIAEDENGRRAVSETRKIIVPESDAVSGVRAVYLGDGEAFVEWRSSEAVHGQVIRHAGDGRQSAGPMEPCPRTFHSRSIRGLDSTTQPSVHIRQALEREKWGNQFLYAAPRRLSEPERTVEYGDARIRLYNDGAAALSSGDLRLFVTAEGGLRIFHAGKDNLDTLLEPSEDEAFFYLETGDGRKIQDFSEDAGLSEPVEAETEFGSCLRVSIKGSHTGDGFGIVRKIQFEVYEKHPGAVVIRVEYEALEGKPRVAAAVGPVLRLDRRMALTVPEAAEPWHFSAYLPVSHKNNFGDTYTAARVTRNFNRPNPTAGDSGNLEHVTGIPFFDLWCPETGVGLGHLSPCPIQVKFPVVTEADGRVNLSFRDERLGEFDAVGRYESPPLLLVAHGGDFYNAVSRFREMMSAQGFAPLKPPEEAYEPAWTTWGYTKSFKPADVRDAIPYLKELGIRWIQFDDPWYSDHGDYAVNEKVFPGGEEEMAELIRELKAKGFKLRLWSCPGNISSNSDYGKKHSERMVSGKDGRPTDVEGAGLPAGMHEWKLCPTVEENIEKVREGVKRLIETLGADALYHDGIYGCPPCQSKEHGHDTDAEVFAAHPRIFREAYRQAVKSLGHDTVVMLCTCGKPPDFYLLPYHNRLATADPMNVHVRKRVKHHKALLGAKAAVDFDIIEVSRNDFASALGTGACLYMEFTTPVEKQLWAEYRRWVKLAAEHPTARGEYLNLYDIAYDYPEAHAVKLGSRLYYGFFASPWAGDKLTEFSGTIELRGLEAGRNYRVRDYAAGRDYPEVSGPTGKLSVNFRGSLLLYAEPK